ncbi:MAG: type I-E CRISPR-associated protein Cas5/CasD [Lachnospiraceae bacterium]|nr:type I-E CRISPR-associated protein Cas5/CasD [Lachnospiraceae bacterium]
MYVLLLRLSAPLQSWGSESMFDTRGTDDMPTKSGVIGMLAAALGKKRDEPLDDLAELEFGIRIDQQGTKVNDFQITQMGTKLNANLSNRAYLSDAVFLAGLGCENIDFLKKLGSALMNPEFPVFLGRKSCPPTQPLLLGIRSTVSLYQALYDEEWQVPDWRRRGAFRFSDRVFLRIVMDDSLTQNGSVKKDVPVSFSPFRREYGYRYIIEMPAKIVTREQVFTVTEHDPMQWL